MKKFLAALVLAFSLTGIYVSADASEALNQQGVQVMGVVSGSLNPLVIQDGRRRRRRWRANNGNGDWMRRRRWMRRRGNNDWHRRGRGRGRRGGDH